MQQMLSEVFGLEILEGGIANLLITHVTQKSKKVSGTAIPSKTVVKP